MVEGLREKIERNMVKAEIFLKNNTKAFIVDISDDYYWADLIFVDEEKVTIKCFSGKSIGMTKTLLWVDIIRFEEYRERVK